MKNSDQTKENQESKKGLNTGNKDQDKDHPEDYLIF